MYASKLQRAETQLDSNAVALPFSLQHEERGSSVEDGTEIHCTTLSEAEYEAEKGKSMTKVMKAKIPQTTV